ncbi:MAG: hypothetical protein LBF61_08255 [Azoarcus sp.]|jgi:hypothetical protein|nr:hypothetical protein [Azoarcus sp.]
MLTLTYRPEVLWDARHVSACIRSIRQWLKRRNTPCRYVWVLEMTKAQRPHYHILVWLPWGCKLPKLDQAQWWPHGMTRMEWARHAVGYAAKYVSKGQDDIILPKGARMYGVGGLEGEALNEARWWALPVWLREQVGKDQPVRRCPCGGGWLDKESGEIFRSPWKVAFRGGSVYAYQGDGPIDWAAFQEKSERIANAAVVA